MHKILLFKKDEYRAKLGEGGRIPRYQEAWGWWCTGLVGIAPAKLHKSYYVHTFFIIYHNLSMKLMIFYNFSLFCCKDFFWGGKGLVKCQGSSPPPQDSPLLFF